MGKGTQFVCNKYLLAFEPFIVFGTVQLAITICFLAICEVSEHLDPFSFGDRRGGLGMQCPGFCLPTLLHSPGSTRKWKTPSYGFTVILWKQLVLTMFGKFDVFKMLLFIFS